jgi:hypothetical protein
MRGWERRCSSENGAHAGMAIFSCLAGNGFWEAQNWATNGWSATTRKLCGGWLNISISFIDPVPPSMSAVLPGRSV